MNQRVSIPTFVPSAALSSFTSSSSAVSQRKSSFVRIRSTVSHVAVAITAVPPQRQSPSMFFGLSRFFGSQEVIALPQNDKDHQEDRAKDVLSQRKVYEWTHTDCGDAAMTKGLPREQWPALGWVEEAVKTVVPVAQNAIYHAAEDLQSSTSSFFSMITGFAGPLLINVATGNFGPEAMTKAYENFQKTFKSNAVGNGGSFEEYRELFSKYIPLDTVAKLDQFLRDDIFGWYRVAGPNPMVIQKLKVPASEFYPSLTNEQFQGIVGFSGDTLEAAHLENRLFYVDYKVFDGVPSGKGKESFVYAPSCLLAVPAVPTTRSTVLPIAIRCGQDPSLPVYTANKNHTDPITWLAAKTTIQASDALLHESVYHLGRTHLLGDLFACATFRSLPDVHPIYKLLNNHFFGTIFINSAAVSFLVNKGGIIDKLTAPSIEQTRDISAAATTDKSFSFNDWMPLKEMADRGVLNATTLHYPYRDDVKVLWPVLKEWVESYITAYYKCDEDVRNDYELANWCKEMSGADNGRLRGFGDTGNGEIQTVKYLVECITMIVFTVSVQHAAMNFPQGTMMQYAPSMPLAGYAPAPNLPKPFSSMNDWISKMLPNLDAANTQLSTAEAIGVLRYTRLGEYKKKLNFAPEEVGDALDEFQESLGVIGAEIQARNKKERLAGLPVYNHLVPKNIPQSINI